MGPWLACNQADATVGPVTGPPPSIGIRAFVPQAGWRQVPFTACASALDGLSAAGSSGETNTSAEALFNTF